MPPDTAVTRLPLAAIDPHALPRDRRTFDEGDLDTLQRSIATEGLRQPIEVFPIEGDRPWGLISGHRRLLAFRRLDAETPAETPSRWAEIPCFIRQPADIPAALAAMVTENEVRAQISPWEKGRLILDCTRFEIFEGPSQAVDALYPALSRQARSRLRGFALVVGALDGALTDPHRLSAARMDRLAAALRAGLAEIITETLAPLRRAPLERQWRALVPAIAEAVLLPDGDEINPTTPTGRPRRLLRLRSGITLRREWTPDGWIIRIDTRHADHPGIVDDILDMVEEWFQREG